MGTRGEIVTRALIPILYGDDQNFAAVFDSTQYFHKSRLALSYVEILTIM